LIVPGHLQDLTLKGNSPFFFASCARSPFLRLAPGLTVLFQAVPFNERQVVSLQQRCSALRCFRPFPGVSVDDPFVSSPKALLQIEINSQLPQPSPPPSPMIPTVESK